MYVVFALCILFSTVRLSEVLRIELVLQKIFGYVYCNRPTTSCWILEPNVGADCSKPAKIFFSLFCQGNCSAAIMHTEENPHIGIIGLLLLASTFSLLPFPT